MGTLKPALWDSQVCFLSFLRLLSVFQQLEQLRRAVSPACALSKRLQPGGFQSSRGGRSGEGGNEFPQGFQAVLAPASKRDQRQHMKSPRCL